VSEIAGERPPRRWSLITVSYNSAATLAAHWDGERPGDVEWIVVDNASVDGSAETAERLGARVIRRADNAGFARANNEGLEIAAGRYIAFVNPDVRVDYATLPVLERTIDEHDAIVAPQLTYPDGRLQPNGRHAPTYPRKVINRLGFPDWSARNYYVLCEPGVARYATWVIGAAITGTAATIRAIGGWDERYFVYEEDKEFCLDAWEAGHPVIVTGDAQWMHSWARATTSLRLKPWLMTFQGEAKFYAQRPGLFLSKRLWRHRRDPVIAWSGRPVHTAAG